jgi:hypothetical protein
MSNLWSGSVEAGQRANAEVQEQPCFCAGPSAKAAGLSLNSQRRAISGMVMIAMQHATAGIERKISAVFLCVLFMSPK